MNFGNLKSPSICWNWVIQVPLESIGPGPELLLPLDGPAKLALQDYDQTVEVPNTFYYALDLVFEPNTAGVSTYELVVAITWERANGEPGKLVDFYQGDILYIYG